MNTPRLAIPLCAVLISVTSACSNNDHAVGAIDMEPEPQGTTSEVLGIARTPADFDEPFVINDGAFQFNDTAENTAPIAIDI